MYNFKLGDIVRSTVDLKLIGTVEGIAEEYLRINGYWHNASNFEPYTSELKVDDKESSGGTKFDDKKVRLELLSPIAIEEMGKVLTFGATKYDAHNWRKGIKWSRVLGASLRHIMAFMGGQDKDPETGLNHLAHAACCIMFLLEYEITHKELDDRYTKPVE